MKTIKFGRSEISYKSSCYFIAEIGHNHQGKLETALEMIKVAASCGVQAVKFQKRDNKTLFTKAYYNRPYDNENSYGLTYGEHREYLEFSKTDFIEIIKCAEENSVEFMCTAFDMPSIDFLEELNINSYKFASADITNIPLLTYAAKLGKPMFLSTGASSLEEIKMTYDAITKYNKKICIMHCTAGYPTEYEDLNLKTIKTLKNEFPDAIIGYSGHDNGILATVIAYMLGAVVVEKHFTLNHSLKGTDHKFSLEPSGLRKQIRDLCRVDISMGSGLKDIVEFEKEARMKMGKSLYTTRALSEGEVISEEDICIKSPASGLPPYYIDRIVGKKLKVSLGEESVLLLDHIE